MKINWKVRLLSVKFWLALVPAILLLAQAVAAPFGYKWDFANLGTQLTGIVNAVFAVLSILGVVMEQIPAAKQLLLLMFTLSNTKRLQQVS